MNKVSRNLIHKSDVNKHLICIICQDLLDDPKRINCGHTFCFDCLSIWTRDNNTCPMCKVKIIKKQISRDLIAFNIINDMTVGCNNTGCPWKSKLGDLIPHLKVCQFDDKKLSENMKNQLIKKEDNKNKSLTERLMEEDDKESNYFDFNNKNGSLKQRLFSKAPEMMKKVLDGDKRREPEHDMDIMDILGLGDDNNFENNNIDNNIKQNLKTSNRKSKASRETNDTNNNLNKNLNTSTTPSMPSEESYVNINNCMGRKRDRSITPSPRSSARGPLRLDLNNSDIEELNIGMVDEDDNMLNEALALSLADYKRSNPNIDI